MTVQLFRLPPPLALLYDDVPTGVVLHLAPPPPPSPWIPRLLPITAPPPTSQRALDPRQSEGHQAWHDLCYHGNRRQFHQGYFHSFIQGFHEVYFGRWEGDGFDDRTSRRSRHRTWHTYDGQWGILATRNVWCPGDSPHQPPKPPVSPWKPLKWLTLLSTVT